MHEKTNKTERLTITLTRSQKLAIREAARRERTTMGKYALKAILNAVYSEKYETK